MRQLLYNRISERVDDCSHDRVVYLITDNVWDRVHWRVWDFAELPVWSRVQDSAFERVFEEMNR